MRGISHSRLGEFIYISIGDVVCQKLKAENLAQLDTVSIENNMVDDKEHKSKCERAFTLLHQHTNCVIHMNLLRKKPEE